MSGTKTEKKRLYNKMRYNLIFVNTNYSNVTSMIEGINLTKI